MLNKIRFIAAFSLIALATTGQTLSVKWGAETEIPNKNDVYKVFNGSDNSIYIVREKDYVNIPSKYFIEKYNPDYSLKFETEIKLPEYNGKEVRYQDVMVIGTRLYAFSTYYEESANRNHCFASEINQNTGEAGTLNKIDEIVSQKKGDPGYFTFRASVDGSKLLIYHHDPFDKYASEKFHFRILDENLKLVNSASFPLTYTDKKFKLSNYSVDKEGNLFLLASIEKENQDKESGKPWYRFVALSYLFKTKELKEYPVEIGDKYVTDITMRQNDRNNSLVVTGFYSEKSSNGLKGGFLMEIDKESKKVIRTGSKDFTPELLSNFMSEGRSKRGKEPQDLSIDYVLFTEDGGIILAAEQSYITTRCTSNSSGQTTCVDTYHNKSILVSKISKTGEFEWSAAIPKLQVSQRSLYGGYYLTRLKDKVYIIYNDCPENLTNKGDKDLENFEIGKKGIVALATIDAKGNVSRQVTMTEEEKSKTVLAPKATVHISDGEAQLFACWGKKMRFGKMSVK